MSVLSFLGLLLGKYQSVFCALAWPLQKIHFMALDPTYPPSIHPFCLSILSGRSERWLIEVLWSWSSCLQPPWDPCFKDLSIHSSPHNFIRQFLDSVRATGNSLFQQKRPKSVLVREVSGRSVYRWVKMVRTTLQTAVCHLHVQPEWGSTSKRSPSYIGRGTHYP